MGSAPQQLMRRNDDEKDKRSETSAEEQNKKRKLIHEVKEQRDKDIQELKDMSINDAHEIEQKKEQAFMDVEQEEVRQSRANHNLAQTKFEQDEAQMDRGIVEKSEELKKSVLAQEQQDLANAEGESVKEVERNEAAQMKKEEELKLKMMQELERMKKKEMAAIEESKGSAVQAVQDGTRESMEEGTSGDDDVTISSTQKPAHVHPDSAKAHHGHQLLHGGGSLISVDARGRTESGSHLDHLLEGVLYVEEGDAAAAGAGSAHMPEAVPAGCVDKMLVGKAWVDSTGDDCHFYEWGRLCTRLGEFGEFWHDIKGGEFRPSPTPAE